MSIKGNDCYFYFYSTCKKGDNCPFRHCEAALGNETICTLWKEGRCFRNVCRFRHMEISKKRSMISCYWENQPGGCQKSNCAFHHTKGRYLNGVFFPPSQTTLPSPPESAGDDPNAAQITVQQSKLSVQSDPSPQLMEVMQMENKESVPSSTHPPVLIKAADDDKGDDDQLSKEGEETKTPVQQPAEENHLGLQIISTTKSDADTKQDDSLNAGIKTLGSEGPSGAPAHRLKSQIVRVPKKENVRTLVSTVMLPAKQGEVPVIRLNIADKPGKQESSVADVSGLPLKRSLVERLGKKIEVDRAPRREKGAKPAGEIHVKTLEEIRLERANQRGETPAAPQAEGCCKVEDPSSGVRPSPAVHIKTFSEALAERKHKRLEEEKQKVEEVLTEKRSKDKRKKKRIFPPPEPGNVKLEEPPRKIKRLEEMHIKSLEEIKQEKALRMQQSGESVPAAAAQPGPAPEGRKLQQIAKPAAPGREEITLLLQPCQRSAAHKAVEEDDFEKFISEILAGELEAKCNVYCCSSPARGQLLTKAVEEDDLEKSSSEFLEEMEGQYDLELEKDVDELHLELSEMIDREVPVSQPNTADKPGKRKSSVADVSGLPLKRSLAERLGKKIKIDRAPRREKGAKPAGEIHVKTLEEIVLKERISEETPAAPQGRRCCKPWDQSTPNSRAQAKSLEGAIKEKLQLRQPKKLKKEVAAVPAAAKETVKAKGKVCVKPSDGKASTPTKRARKRKAAEISPSAVAAVKPLSSTEEEEPPAKKAALTAGPALPEVSLLTKPGVEKPPSSLELQLGSQADSVEQSEDSSSASASSQSVAKAQQLSSTGAGKTPLSVEDDTEKFISEISGGEMEAEIDLDLEKDEDDFLRELSEMTDC
ncbi:zinc finger CCCH domain-containing protein 11A [Coturnix japonica]|uniref:zinc finger CCCH domain-containing protein 11A n=1 Tax=Coturnix japonica TaxID=93934 RepID=UPI0013A5E493|nr:zinc finger CCCH domain-containing protein 11A [Coturnix japonica]